MLGPGATSKPGLKASADFGVGFVGVAPSKILSHDGDAIFMKLEGQPQSSTQAPSGHVVHGSIVLAEGVHATR